MMNDTGSLANRYQQNAGGFWGTPSDPNRPLIEALDRVAGLLERLITATDAVTAPAPPSTIFSVGDHVAPAGVCGFLVGKVAKIESNGRWVIVEFPHEYGNRAFQASNLRLLSTA